MAGAVTPMQRLSVSAHDPHCLAYEDGTGFFYLGDTVWELFRRTTRQEADRYLKIRKQQGFTVIMVCGPGAEKTSGKLDTGIHLPNRYGFKPFENNDFKTPKVVAGPDNDYWDHVDYVIDKCEELGLYVALLPYWARDYVPYPIDAPTGYQLAHWYGQRYGDRIHVIWTLGGDNKGNNPREIEIFDKTAQGIAQGAGKNQSELLMTYHCNGWQDDPHSSGYYLHDKPWLDFNGAQSGHYRDGVQGPYFNPPYQTMSDDYARRPVKPSVNLEAVYEGIYDGFRTSNPRLNAHDVRKTAYWTMFAGGAGYTYGNNNVWQFYSERYEPRFFADTAWDQAMDNASAHQMTVMKRLVLSRPFLRRVPDQTIIVSGVGTRGDYKTAVRANDGSYAMVYAPTQQAFTVNTSTLSGAINAWWYNPQDGSCYNQDAAITTTPFAQYAGDGTVEFTPPSDNPDWVLVLDDAAKGFPIPGQ
jgi:Protein of unknown function (DUF4038)/Putative collagen-binding domain of a collagenase